VYAALLGRDVQEALMPRAQGRAGAAAAPRL